jgi:hypothetical protein
MPARRGVPRSTAHPAKGILAVRRITVRCAAQAIAVNELVLGRMLNGNEPSTPRIPGWPCCAAECPGQATVRRRRGEVRGVRAYNDQLRAFAAGETDEFVTESGVVRRRLRFDDGPERLEILTNDGVSRISEFGDRLPRLLLALVNARTPAEVDATLSSEFGMSLNEVDEFLSGRFGMTATEKLNHSKPRN